MNNNPPLTFSQLRPGSTVTWESSDHPELGQLHGQLHADVAVGLVFLPTGGTWPRLAQKLLGDYDLEAGLLVDSEDNPAITVRLA